jgi:hypothetical protein
MIKKELLETLYFKEGKSMQDIALLLKCSLHKVAYWINKHEIKTRSWSEATYLKRNPHGDPFKFRMPKDKNEERLFGLGLGLYWGEGTKADRNSIRLGNTDPELLNKFINFLTKFFTINRRDLKFGLQIFSDIDPEEAMDFWIKGIRIRRTQINKPTITRSGSIGTYRKKSLYGVMTVYYHNKKARDLLIGQLPM